MNYITKFSKGIVFNSKVKDDELVTYFHRENIEKRIYAIEDDNKMLNDLLISFKKLMKKQN